MCALRNSITLGFQFEKKILKDIAMQMCDLIQLVRIKVGFEVNTVGFSHEKMLCEIIFSNKFSFFVGPSDNDGRKLDLKSVHGQAHDAHSNRDATGLVSPDLGSPDADGPKNQNSDHRRQPSFLIAITGKKWQTWSEI